MVEWQKQNYLPQSTLPSFFSNKSLASFLGMSWPRAYLSQALWQLGWPVRHRWKLLGGMSGKTFWPALFFLLHPNRNEGMMAGAAETTLCLWKWKTCAEYRRTERKSIVFWYMSIVYIIYMYSTHTYYMILIITYFSQPCWPFWLWIPLTWDRALCLLFRLFLLVT